VSAASVSGHDSPLTADQVYEMVSQRVAEALGPHGRYSLVLRSAHDTDAIFSTLATRSLSLAITQAILGADDIETNDAARHRAVAESARREHAAIAVWADPVRHDPNHVDDRLVSPPITQSVPVRAVASF
jgi:hypothetical protein